MKAYNAWWHACSDSTLSLHCVHCGCSLTIVVVLSLRIGIPSSFSYPTTATTAMGRIQKISQNPVYSARKYPVKTGTQWKPANLDIGRWIWCVQTRWDTTHSMKFYVNTPALLVPYSHKPPGLFSPSKDYPKSIGHVQTLDGDFWVKPANRITERRLVMARPVSVKPVSTQDSDWLLNRELQAPGRSWRQQKSMVTMSIWIQILKQPRKKKTTSQST
jgi:hypothetical protein